MSASVFVKLDSHKGNVVVVKGASGPITQSFDDAALQLGGIGVSQ